MGGLFNRPTPVAEEIPEQSQAIAREIYGLLVGGESRAKVFKKNSGYRWWWITWVYGTAKNLEAEALASIIANPNQTNLQWANSVSTVKLNKVDVLWDIIHANPTRDDGRTFEEFVIAMTGE